MHVLFVYPALSVGGFGALYRPEMPDGCYASHGLMSLSAVLKADGHTTELLDLRGLKSWEDTEQKITAASYDIAMVSYLSSDCLNGERVIKILRRCHPKRAIAVGGLHVTLTGSRPEGANFVVHGQGERAVRGICGLNPNGELPDREVWYRSPIPTVELPIPDRDLFGDREANNPIFAGLRPPQATVLAGRGCYGHCTFCYQSKDRVFGMGDMRNEDALWYEIDRLHDRLGFRSIMLHDDHQWSPSFLSRFVKEVRIRYVGDIDLWFQIRPETVVDMQRLLGEIRQSCRTLWLSIGFESGSDRVLGFLEKGARVAHNLEAARICHELDIKIFSNYMLGIPTESPEEMRQTVEMVHQIRPERHSPCIYTNFPGTVLYDYCQERDLILPDRFMDNPWAHKIRGIDYDVVRKMIAEATTT